jgi:phosphatidate cytidylyltransferase
MHFKRLIVAAVLLPALYFYIMYLPQVYFFFLLISVSLVAMSEFYHMYRVTGIFRYAGLLSGISILGVSYMYHDHLMDIAAISVMILMVMRLLFKRDPVTSLADIAPLIVGLVYVPFLFSFQAELRKIGPEWIIFLYASVWASDSMAYYIGKGIGKRKLYMEVSPNKTVAGAAGSLIGGITGAFILKALIVPQITATTAFFIGATIGIISVIGDLIESMFKRDAGVKDSGVIIPGHGGILDKIDGSLFAGPVLYWVLTALSIK